MLVTIHCHHCGGPIESDTDDLNRAVDCPHCQQKTFLASPKGQAGPMTPAYTTLAGNKRKSTTPVWVWWVAAPIGLLVLLWMAGYLLNNESLSIVGTVLFIVLGIGFYFVPTLIAHKKRAAGAIFLLNLVAGWTFVGWVVALVWAAVPDKTMKD